MIRTVLLVPVRDNAGKVFRPADWRELQRRLRALGGGLTRVSGAAYGEWSNSDNVLFRDRSRVYTISFDVNRLGDWWVVVQWARERFHQEALYVEITGTGTIGGG